MIQTQAAIPTIYKGRRFRSRLEARWAAFFDLMKWPYEYEPFDLRGWIPDFVLTSGLQALVEVKPYLEWAQAEEWRRSEKFIHTVENTDYWGHPLFLLPASVRVSGIWSDLGKPVPWFGWVLLMNAKGTEYENEFESLNGTRAVLKGPVGACAHCYEDDLVHGGITLHNNNPRWVSYEKEVAPLWQEAGNMVQWRRS